MKRNEKISRRLVIPLLASIFNAAPVYCDAEGDEHGEGMDGLVDNLFLGESPFTSEQGELELQLTAAHRDGEEQETELSIEFQYGLTDRLTLEVVLPYLYLDGEEGSVDGLGDVELGAIYNPVNQIRFR